MIVYHRFLIILWLLYVGTTLLLALAGSTQWDLYYTLYLIEYLSLTTVFSLVSPSARKALNMIGLLLLPGFVAIVGVRVMAILGTAS